MSQNVKSPNVGREIQAIVRRIPAEKCVPVAPSSEPWPCAQIVGARALLNELARWYVTELGGAAPVKAKLLRYTGLDEAGLAEARRMLVAAGLIGFLPRPEQSSLYTLNRAALEAVADPAPERKGRTANG